MAKMVSKKTRSTSKSAREFRAGVSNGSKDPVKKGGKKPSKGGKKPGK